MRVAVAVRVGFLGEQPAILIQELILAAVFIGQGCQVVVFINREFGYLAVRCHNSLWFTVCISLNSNYVSKTVRDLIELAGLVVTEFNQGGTTIQIEVAMCRPSLSKRYGILEAEAASLTQRT